MRIVPTGLPAVEPILLEEAKEHLRLDSSDEDTSLAALIVAARAILETATGLTLISRSFDLLYDDWFELEGHERPVEDWLHRGHSTLASSIGKTQGWRLPLRPVTAINSFHVVNAEGAEVPWGSENYRLSGGMEPKLHLVLGPSLPPLGRNYEAIRISVQAGFGPSWNDMPADIHQALLLLITYLSYNKGDQNEPAADLVQAAGVKGLLGPYRRLRL